MSVAFAFFVEHLIVFCFPGWQSSPEITGWIKGIQWIWWTAKVQLKAEAVTASRMYGNGLVFMARFGGCFCPPPSLEILFRNKHGTKIWAVFAGIEAAPKQRNKQVRLQNSNDWMISCVFLPDFERVIVMEEGLNLNKFRGHQDPHPAKEEEEHGN